MTYRLRRALHETPDDDAAFAQLKAEWEDSKRFAVLAERFALRTDDAGRKAARFYDAASAYERAGLLRQALAAAVRAGQADAALLEAQLLGMRLALRLGRHAQAAQLFHEAAKRHPLGGDLLQTLEALLDACEGAPHLHPLAETLVGALEPSEAARRRRALDAWRDDVEPRLKRLRAAAMGTRDKTQARDSYLTMAGLLLVYAHEPERARAEIDRTLLLAPGDAHALRMLTFVEGEQAYDTVKAQAQKALAKDRTAAAWILADFADAAPAREEDALLQAYTCDEREPYVLQRLKCLYAARGDRAALLAFLDRALTRAPDPATELLLREWRYESAPDDGLAAQMLERIREIEPVHAEALAALERTRRDAHDSAGLLSLFSTVGRYLEGAERSRVLDEQAELFASHANLAQAYEAQRESLLCWPTSERAKRLIGFTSDADLARTRQAIDQAVAVVASDYRVELEQVRSSFIEENEVVAAAASQPTASAETEAERMQRLEARMHGIDPNDAEALRPVLQEILAQDPEHENALALLTDVYRREQRWAELAQLLERRISLELSQGPAEPSPLRKWQRELAKLYEQRLGRPKDAVALSLSLFHSGDDGAELVSALERAVAAGHCADEAALALATRESPEKARAHAEAVLQRSRDPALLRRAMLLLAQSDKDAGFARLRTALLANPEDAELFLALEHAAARAGKKDEWRNALEALLELKTLASSTRGAVAWKLAEAYRAASLGEKAALASAASYLAAPSAHPAPETVVAALLEYGHYETLDEVHSLRVEAATGDALAEALAELVALRREHLRGKGLREALERLLLLRPGDPAVVAELAALMGCGQQKLYEEQLAAAQSDAQRGPLLVALAAMSPKAEALVALEAALATTARPQAIAALKAMGTDTDAARLLLPLALQSGDRDEEMRCHSVLANAATGFDRARHLRALLALWTEKKDDVGAFFVAKEAFIAEGGADVELEETLITMSRLLGRPSELHDALRRALETATVDRAKALSLRLASVLQMENTVSDETTIEAWRQAVAADPSNIEALGSLEKALREAGRLRDLVEVLRMRQSAEPARRVELGLELAGIFSGPLEDQSQAIAEFYAAAELSPTDSRPYKGLADLYLANRQFSEGKEALTKELERTPDVPERRSRLVLLARVFFEGLQDIDGAIASASEVLKADPQHAEATALLEQVMQIVSPETQGQLAAVLEPAYLAQNNFPKMAHVREIRIDTTQDPAQKRELVLDAAKLYETRGNDPQAAMSLLGQAFRIDPRDERVRADLERLATKANALETLANEYEAVLQVITDTGPLITLHRRLAELYEKTLKRPEDAVKHLQATADLAGGDTQSLDQMARLLRQQDKPAELADVLAKLASLIPETQKDQRVKLLMELGEIRLTKTEDKEGAVWAYQQIVNADPKHAKALEALDKLLSELERKQDLIPVLLLRRDVAGASDLGVDINVRLGDLHKERPQEAMVFYKTALQRRPQNAPALAALETLLDHPDVQMDVAAILEPLYTAKQDYARLARVLEVRLGRAAALAEKKGLMRRIGDIYENRLSQKDKAFAMSLRAMREDPADMGIRMWLEKLAQETGQFAELADAYVEQALRAEPPLALQFHRRAAALYYEKVNDPQKAIDEFREVLSRDAKDLAAHNALEKLYGQTEQKREQAEILLRLVDLNAGLERKLELLNNAATLQEEIGELETALATRKRIAQHAPEDAGNFDAMGTVYEKLGRPEEWVKALDSEIGRIGEKRGPEARGRKLDLLYRKGLVTELALSDPNEAARIFDLILQQEPSHTKTIDHLEERVRAGQAAFAAVALERVYQQNGDWRKFVDVLEAQLGQTADHEARKLLLIKIAHTQQNKLNSQDMAFLSLSRAFGEDSSDGEVRNELERLADANGNHEELVELYASEIDVIADPILKLQLTNKVAEIYHKRMGDKEQAIAWYRRVLAHDAQNPAALRSLDVLYGETEAWAALAEVLEVEVAGAAKDEDKIELLVRLGTVWGDKMFEPDAAIRALEQARGIKADDLRVLRSLERYFGEAKAYDELAKVLRELDTHPEQTKQEQVRVRGELAKTLRDHLRDPGGSVDAWMQVLELDPGNAGAIMALDILLPELGRYQELADVMQKAIDTVSDPAIRIEYNQRLAEIMSEHLGNTEVGVMRWLEVLKAEPKRVDALRALIALYGRRSEWVEQAEMAKRLIPLVPPSEGKAVRFVRMDALSHIEPSREDAIFIGREILSAAPHTPEELEKLADLFEAVTSFEDAAKAVDRSVELQPSAEARLRALRRSADIYLDRLNRPTAAVPSYEKILEINPGDKGAFDQVRKILRNAREWRRLVATDEGFVSQYQGEGRLELLEEIRDIHDRELGQKDLAFIAACRVFREEPNEASSMAAERLAAEIEGYEELVAVYEDAIEEIEDARKKLEVYRRLGRVYTEKMGELGAAEEAYEQLLNLSPGDTDALDRLVEIRGKQGRVEDLVNALEAKLDHAPDFDARKAILRQIASVWDQLANDVEKAIASHQRILDLDPSDKIAIDALSAIYERENRFDALIDILTRAIDLANDKRVTIPLREKIGALYEGRLENPEKAIETYRSVLELDPAHLGTLQALERLYTQLQRWRELLEVFEKQIVAVEDNDEKIKLFTKAATIFEENFEDKKNALICYDNILALDANNLSALKNEERLLRDVKEWEKLIQVLQHHATLLADPADIVNLYISIGEIFYKSLSRVDKAEEYFNAARSLDPEATDALNALGKLYERSGNWFQSIEMLQKEAEAAKDSPAAVDLYYRMGKINENMLMDTGAAKGCYQRALEINPKYVPALAALKDIAQADKDWQNYIQYMVEEADATEDAELKTELFYEAGKYYQEKNDDHESAARFYEKALEHTPDYAEAARPLSELYFRKEDWQAAEQVLEIVVSKLDPKADVKELGQKTYRLGYLADKQRKHDVALERYERAFEIDSTYLPTLEGLGHAYIRVENWEQAMKAFNAIIVHHRDSLTNAEVVDLFAQTGDLLLKTGQLEKAKKQFEKALEIEPEHATSLRVLAKVQEEIGDMEGAYDALHRYIDVSPASERASILLSIAQLSRDKLHDPYRAIDALLEAQKLEPDNTDVLEALVQLYTDTKQIPKIAELSEQIVALVKDDRKKIAYALRLGAIFKNEIKDLNKALKYYNAALDIDAGQAAAFEAIEGMLSDLGEWKMLEENYRAMIARLPVTARKAKAAMFRTLAELYKQVLKELDNATTAYEVVVKLDPGNASDQLTLAALYGEKPELRPKAIAMQQELLRSSQNMVPALHELRKLYQADKKFDKVYCIVAALQYMKQANEEEKKILEYLKKGLPAKASKPLTEALVRDHLLHPGVRTGIGELASGLYKAAPDVFTRPAKDLDLKKKDQVDVKASQLFFVNILKYVAGVLSAPAVDVYRRSGSLAELELLNSRPPAIAAGEENAVFRESSHKILCFHIARNLTFARPELFLARIYPGDQLRDLLTAFIAMFNPKAATLGNPAEVQSWVEVLQHIPEAQLRRIKDLAIAGYNDLKAGMLAAFTEAAEHSGYRAAMLLSGDLEVAGRGAAEAQDGAARIAAQERVKELVLFSVSEDHFLLREAMGLAIKG